MLGCDRPKVEAAKKEPPPPQTQPAPRTELLPDPRIINAHEHVAHDPQALAALEEANRRVGITSVALIGSSRYTLRMDRSGFVEHHENNEFLCQLARERPDEYFAFVTFDPLEADIVRKLQDYLAKGASGVKLYLGHGAKVGDGTPFHRFELNDPHILPLYDYCQDHDVPILFHINLRQFEPEARRVFDAYPKLRVIIPHFGLKLGRLEEFDALMEHYPSLYTDLSFGWPQFQFEGLQRIHNNPNAVRDFLIKYQDRIFFGTDVVVISAKSVDFLTDSYLAYRHMLEFSEYDFRIGQYDEHFRGLALPEWLLRKIYRDNFLRFIHDAPR